MRGIVDKFSVILQFKKEAMLRIQAEKLSGLYSVYPKVFGDERGYFFEPTWLTQLQTDDSVLNDEPFGPIGTLTTFSTMDEVITEANRLPFALAAYVFTRSLTKTHATVDRLQATLEFIFHPFITLRFFQRTG
jgi:succinate-semialdehyde dehydrogenase/glutarate-semialdehyde dehydrogenase